ncbi:cysteine hydrolase, partial [Pseudomonas syringae pv. tagetis]
CTADIVHPVRNLLLAARAAGMMVVYIRHIVRGDGSDTGRMRDVYPNVDQILARLDPEVEIIAALAPQSGDVIVGKLF